MTSLHRAFAVAACLTVGCGGASAPPSKTVAPAASSRAPSDEVAVVARAPGSTQRDYGASLPAERGVRVAWSRDGRTLATTGRDRAGHGGAERFTVRLWDLSRGALVALVAAHRAPITALAFTPGEELITASLDGTMRVWNTRSGTLLGTLDHARLRRERPGANVPAKGQQGWGALPVAVMDLSADGNTIASTSGGREVALWAVAGSELLTVLEGRERAATQRVSTRDALRGGHVEPVSCIAFSPDSRTLATGSRLDGTVRLWDAKTFAVRRVLGVAAAADAAATHADAGPTSLSWSGDGATLAVGTARGTVEIWDAASGTRTAVVDGVRREQPVDGDGQAAISSVALRPHGSTLASAATEGAARLFRVRHAPSFVTEVRLGGNQRAAIEQVAWSRDGHFLAVAGDGLVLARARDGATVALHASVDEDGHARWLVEADDGHVDGDPGALEDLDLQRTPGVLRAFFAGR